MARLAAAIGPRYRVDGAIARGGMACVFKGFNTSLQAPVALKVLELAGASAADEQRFERECRVQARLDHPNIVRVSDSFVYPDLRVLVMEFVNGPSLKDALKKRGRLPVRRRAAHRAADPGCAGVRPQRRSGAPGHQAGKHSPQAQPGAARRFRHRHGGGLGWRNTHEPGPVTGDAGLHVAGAEGRQDWSGRSAERPLLPGTDTAAVPSRAQ